jgi:E3 Ubiquitin ligase
LSIIVVMSHVVLADPVTLLTRLAILAAIATGIGAGSYFFVRGFALLQRKHLILNTPRSTVRGAAIGLVEVSGTAAGPYTLISPLAQSDCFYYRAMAWQAEEEQKRWRKVAEEKLYAPFFVADETGQMMVDLRAAEIDLPPAFSEEVLPGDALEYMQHFLNRHGVSPDSSVRLEERCIRPGDKLFVMGTLQENPRTTLNSQPEVFDHAGAEPVSEAAADLQRRRALETLHISEAELANRSPHPPTAGNFDLQPAIILGKGAHHPFVISNRSEREVILDMAWRSTLYIWGGPILALTCLWLLISRLA